MASSPSMILDWSWSLLELLRPVLEGFINRYSCIEMSQVDRDSKAALIIDRP